MEVLQLVGRIAFATLFISSGIAHFANRESMVAYSRAMGGPAPALMVPLSGLMILAGGLLVLLGVWPDLGALLIAAFLLPAAYYMHAFWKVDDPQQRASEQAQFMKNLSLFGASLVLFYLFAEHGEEMEMLLGEPLF